MGDSDSLHYQLTGGEGIARYIGLGITADSACDVARDELNPTGVLAGYVGWRHAFSPKRTNLIYARSDYDNDSILGPLVTKSVQSVRGNIFYSPLPKVDIGAELMYGRREVENGNKGDITRLQFTTKYSFRSVPASGRHLPRWGAGQGRHLPTECRPTVGTHQQRLLRRGSVPCPVHPAPHIKRAP